MPHGVATRESFLARPSLKQLEYFLAVTRCGSLRRAADELSISQPTLTAQIARLEQALAVRLFERTRKGVYPTPAGRRLEPLARRTVESLDELVNTAVDTRGGVASTYRLGVSATLGPYLLPRIMPALHATYADLKLYIREDSTQGLEEGLARNRYDLILTSAATGHGELVVQPLMREAVRLVLPANHPLAASPRVAASELAGQQILTIEEGQWFARQVEGLCTRLGAQILRDYEGTSLDALRVMVMMGMGLTFLPALYIASEIDADSGLAVRDLDGDSIDRLHTLAWRPTSPDRAFYRRLAGDMRRILKEQVGDLVEVVGGRDESD